jgi:hypothetical protein
VQGQLSRTSANDSPTTPFPDLAAGARYLHLNNAGKRNALSVAVLRNLRDQLHAYNRSPVDGQARYLPPFEPGLLAELEKAFSHSDSEAGRAYGWLVDANEWRRHRSGLPRVIVLRSAGPVFCSGHDLNEIHRMSHAEAKALFDLCAEVMSLIRRCPVPVVGAIQGLATAAGAQLALTTDLPVAHASTPFRLPGSSMGFPCISPVTAVSRNVGNAFAYEMFTLSKTYRADELPGRPLQVATTMSRLTRPSARWSHIIRNEQRPSHTRSGNGPTGRKSACTPKRRPPMDMETQRHGQARRWRSSRRRPMRKRALGRFWPRGNPLG